MPSLSLRCPAKVNLVLNILGRRDDGFHELETVMLPLDLADKLTVERTETPGSIRFRCSDSRVPTGAENLVVRAAEQFTKAINSSDGLSIRLEKHIPMAAGLGGGSSDAAHALTGLNQLYNHPLTGAQLHDLAARLGSDVPFFLHDQTAIATGRGETLTPLPSASIPSEARLLLIRPGFGVATGWAYTALGQRPEWRQGQAGRARAMADALESGHWPRVAQNLFNSLEAPVFQKYPWLAIAKDFLRDRGADNALMSGSGSTTFAVCRNAETAERLRQDVATEFGPDIWTTVTRPLEKPTA